MIAEILKNDFISNKFFESSLEENPEIDLNNALAKIKSMIVSLILTQKNLSVKLSLDFLEEIHEARKKLIYIIKEKKLNLDLSKELQNIFTHSYNEEFKKFELLRLNEIFESSINFMNLLNSKKIKSPFPVEINDLTYAQFQDKMINQNNSSNISLLKLFDCTLNYEFAFLIYTLFLLKEIELSQNQIDELTYFTEQNFMDYTTVIKEIGFIKPNKNLTKSIV